MNAKLAFVLAVLPALVSCRSTPESYDPQIYDSGLTVQELVVPKGRVARNGDDVKIHYHGTLPNKVVFDSSVERGQPLEFTLGAGEVPPGLEQGITGMHLFGRRKLTAPIELMFPEGIPLELQGFSYVLLSVELLEINRPD